MRPSTIWYTLKQGIKNIKRNFMFSIASIITMAACIFLFGIFFSIVNNVNTLAHNVEEDVRRNKGRRVHRSQCFLMKEPHRSRWMQLEN